MSADDPDRPPTDEELAEAAKLRDALDEDPIAGIGDSRMLRWSELAPERYSGLNIGNVA